MLESFQVIQNQPLSVSAEVLAFVSRNCLIRNAPIQMNATTDMWSAHGHASAQTRIIPTFIQINLYLLASPPLDFYLPTHICLRPLQAGRLSIRAVLAENSDHLVTANDIRWLKVNLRNLHFVVSV